MKILIKGITENEKVVRCVVDVENRREIWDEIKDSCGLMEAETDEEFMELFLELGFTVEGYKSDEDIEGIVIIGA